MLSAGVLEDEKRIMEEIIEYKKSQNIEYDFFEIKKDLLDGQILNIQNLIISESLTLEGYKDNIKTQLNYENNLLIILEEEKVKEKEIVKDNKLNEEQIQIIINRINKRIEILNSEFMQQINEEEEENQLEKQESEINIELIKEKESENLDINKKQEIESVEIKTPIKEILIKNQFLYDTLKKRQIEYQLAIEYFDKHDLTTQSKDAFLKLGELNKAIKLLESGIEILDTNNNDFTIPESITPDYISGCSKQERFEKFSKLIKEYGNIKNELVNKKNKILENFNLLEKREQNKIVYKYIKLY
jgi:hypothetical protein